MAVHLTISPEDVTRFHRDRADMVQAIGLATYNARVVAALQHISLRPATINSELARIDRILVDTWLLTNT